MPPLNATPPVPLRVVIQSGLRGAFLLARARPEGLAQIEETPAGALRSFWAAALCLPAFLALRFLAWAGTGAPPRGIGFALAAEFLGYASAWAGFALASRALAEGAGRLKEWPRFIAAWNWANVVQYLVLLALAAPAQLGLSGVLSIGLELAAFGYALWLEWFVARHALRVGGFRAAGFVLLDLVLGLFIGGFVGRLSGG